MNTSRRTRPALMVTALLAVLLWPVPAHAADEIGFSVDGVTWSSSLAEPLFNPSLRWVPGDSQVASFYVRNQGPSSAAMTIEARIADTDHLLDHHDIDLQARAVGESWVTLENGVASRPMTTDSIALAGVVQIEVSATFDPASVNQSQSKQLPLTFTVFVSDAAAGPGDEEPSPEMPGAPGVDAGPGGSDAATAGRDGSLPGTGATVGPQHLLAALAFCAIGAVVLARRSPDDDAQAGAIS